MFGSVDVSDVNRKAKRRHPSLLQHKRQETHFEFEEAQEILKTSLDC